jgi:hypothetical protein
VKERRRRKSGRKVRAGGEQLEDKFYFSNSNKKGEKLSVYLIDY